MPQKQRISGKRLIDSLRVAGFPDKHIAKLMDRRTQLLILAVLEDKVIIRRVGSTIVWPGHSDPGVRERAEEETIRGAMSRSRGAPPYRPWG